MALASIVTTPRGTPYRGVKGPKFVPFSKVMLKGPGSPQRSHIIPKDSAKQFSELFKLMDEARENGRSGFDWNNFLENGQPLPSQNYGADGVAIFDLSQHNGSHPVMNDIASS